MTELELAEKALILPIKGEWFGKIDRREKSEEYREIKPYWTKRLRNAGMLDAEGKPTGKLGEAILSCGYRPENPRMWIRYVLRIGEGRPEWGAEPGKLYYVLGIIRQRRLT